jgi:hypothetical protein
MRWVSVFAGAWLFISSWFFPVPVGARVGQWVAGAVIFLASFVAMALPRARRLVTLMGLWSMLMPFVLALHGERAGLNELGMGLVVVVASLWPIHAWEVRGRPVRP